MGRCRAGGSKAGSGVQRRVPSSGSGGQAWEGFPGRKDRHRDQRVRDGVGIETYSSLCPCPSLGLGLQSVQ